MSMSPGVVDVLLQHRERFLAFLAPRVGGREAAEEVLQAALLQGLERGGQVREEERAVAWFYRLLRNALVDRHRADARAEQALARLSDEPAALGAGEARALESAVCACVAGLTATLKPEYREVLRRVDEEEADLAAFAGEAGLTYGNAKVRLHRARQALARRIEQACGPTCCRKGCADCPCEPV
jgi:RNA polymerase sigma-70 factor (ECF subfamily)